MEVSKTKSSFYRRLYVAWLIDSHIASNVPALTEVTGMPRRTAQDTIAALADLDIVCEFEQQDGARNQPGAIRFAVGAPSTKPGWGSIWNRLNRCLVTLSRAHGDVWNVIFKVLLALSMETVLLIKRP